MNPEPARPRFFPGNNIAMKVPPHQYDEVIRFYRDVLGFRLLDSHPPEIGFEFGRKNLWIDRVSGISQAEIWLEVITDDIESAGEYLAAQAIVRRDEIEPLPPGMKAFWISSPASVIHLVCHDRQSWT